MRTYTVITGSVCGFLVLSSEALDGLRETHPECYALLAQQLLHEQRAVALQTIGTVALSMAAEVPVDAAAQ